MAVLPEVFYQRRANRGLENVAISPDGKTAVTFMQSPMGKATNSSVVHSAVLDISDVQAPKLTAVYLYLGEDKGGGPWPAVTAAEHALLPAGTGLSLLLAVLSLLFMMMQP